MGYSHAAEHEEQEPEARATPGDESEDLSKEEAIAHPQRGVLRKEGVNPELGLR